MNESQLTNNDKKKYNENYYEYSFICIKIVT